MKISICVPIYGTESYIGKCARSLFEQKYDDIEFIFVNDCTKDQAVEKLRTIAEEYPALSSKIKIINHEHNTGLAGARLTGLENATGEYIWCVDSDDYVNEHAVESILPYMQEGYDYIAFNYFIDNGQSITKFESKAITVDDLLINRIPPTIWRCVVKKELYTKYNIYPVIGINSSEDYLMTARLVLVAQKKIKLDDCLYYYNTANLGSYMNNMKVSNYENSADSALIVYDFYKKQHAVKKYRNALACRLAMCYARLKQIDKNNEKLENLALTIKQLNKMYYIIANCCLRLSEKLQILRFFYMIGHKI